MRKTRRGKEENKRKIERSQPPAGARVYRASEKMDKEKKAIERIKMASEMSLYHYGRPLVCTYSGGKDSDVMLEILSDPGSLLKYITAIQRQMRHRQFGISGRYFESWNCMELSAR